jgi:site-specific DNA recombinase
MRVSNSNAFTLNYNFGITIADYQIDGRLLPALKAQLQATFTQLNQSGLDQLKVLRQGIAQQEKRLLDLEERFINREIDREMFERYRQKFGQEKQALEAELQKGKGKLSNFSEYVEKSLLMASQLASLWQQGEQPVQEKLQYLLFPEGVQYEHEKGQYRTGRMNAIFSLIHSLSTASNTKKEGKTDADDQFSPWVAPPGIEPRSKV